MLANDHDRLRGSDVVTRLPLGFIRDGAEIFFDKLLSARQTVASAHGHNYGRFTQRSTCSPHKLFIFSDWRVIQAAFLAFTFAHLAR